MGQRFLAESGYGNYDKDELSVANGWLETYVRHFPDGYLKGDAAGRAFLNIPAAETGAPAHLLTVYKTHAQGVPPTRAAFAAELAQGLRTSLRDLSGLAEAGTRLRPIGWRTECLGHKLLGDGEVRSYIAILRLNAELHAGSWNAFDSFGEAYAKDGNRALAAEAYRKSLARGSASSPSELSGER